MNEEIKEMAEELSYEFKCNGGCRNCKYNYSPNMSCIDVLKAEKLYNAGYRKTIWHKVADGDLPTKDGAYYCYCPNEYIEYLVLDYDIKRHNFYYAEYYESWDVVAWTELPKYKEE